MTTPSPNGIGPRTVPSTRSSIRSSAIAPATTAGASRSETRIHSAVAAKTTIETWNGEGVRTRQISTVSRGGCFTAATQRFRPRSLLPSARRAYDQVRMRAYLVVLAWLWHPVFVAGANAGVLHGKIELPARLPDRAPPASKAFLDRIENPFLPVRTENIVQQLVVVVEGDAKPAAPPQVTWNLVGESFGRSVIAAPVGAEVVIKNQSRTSRTLTAAEDPKLLPLGPINPTATKSFRVTEANKVFTIGDKDAPHLIGRVVVVASQYIAYPDESGRYDIPDVPAGTYKVRIWFRTGWLQKPDDQVAVAAKGKTELNLKLPADAFAAKAK